MTGLRNRFAKSSTFVEAARNWGVFETYSEDQKTDKEVNALFADIESKLPAHLSDAEKQKKMAEIKQTYEKNAEIINTLAKSAEMQELVTALSAMANLTVPEPKNQKSLHPEDQSFLSILGKKFIEATTGNALSGIPYIGGLLAMFLPVIASDTILKIFKDTPSGATNLCDKHIFGCINGYLAPSEDGWNDQLPIFNRLVTQSAGKSDDAAYHQLRTCLDLEKVGGIVRDSFNPLSNETTSVCTVKSIGEWHGYDVSSTVQYLSAEDCEKFKNAFAAASQSCKSLVGKLKYDAIFGGIGAGVFLLALCAGSFWWYKKTNECICKNVPNPC